MSIYIDHVYVFTVKVNIQWWVYLIESLIKCRWYMYMFCDANGAFSFVFFRYVPRHWSNETNCDGLVVPSM